MSAEPSMNRTGDCLAGFDAMSGLRRNRTIGTSTAIELDQAVNALQAGSGTSQRKYSSDA
jgi:hypothetical protein